MKSFIIKSILMVLLSIIFGCTYRYYLGFHGPSIQLNPEQHEGVTQDKECLECHDPKNDPEGPPTSHPQFTGCIKCHNDEVNKVKIKTSVADLQRASNSFRLKIGASFVNYRDVGERLKIESDRIKMNSGRL